MLQKLFLDQPDLVIFGALQNLECSWTPHSQSQDPSRTWNVFDLIELGIFLVYLWDHPGPSIFYGVSVCGQGL